MTYQQPKKEESRQIIWNRAISLLTKDRNYSRILEEEKICRLWDYAFEKCIFKYTKVKNADRTYLNDWIDFSNNTYGSKAPNNLKIAYFCGTEPQNDLDILVDLGVRIENIWAFESDKKSYKEALMNAKKHYPALKIHHGSFQSFSNSSKTQFDIIYLDFTAPIFSKEAKPFDAIHKVFDNQSLSELSVLIINSCIPDNNADSCSFLDSFFLNQPFIEGGVLGEMTNTGELITWYIEGALEEGYDSIGQLPIASNFDCAYSAFATLYPMLYSTIIQPAYRVLRTNELKRQFFSSEKLNHVSNKVSSEKDFLSFLSEEIEDIFPRGGDIYYNRQGYPLWNQLLELKELKGNHCKCWYDYFCNQKESGVSRFDAVKFSEILRTAPYDGYLRDFSEQLLSAICQIEKAVPDKEYGELYGLFCDVPLRIIWIELILNQLGVPYHCNLSKHCRGAYQAKTRTMMFDVFVFDRCRSLYDWLPLLDSYGDTFGVLEKQIIIRSCIDSITKQTRETIPYSYYGASLVCINEESGAFPIPEMPPRNNL